MSAAAAGRPAEAGCLPACSSAWPFLCAEPFLTSPLGRAALTAAGATLRGLPGPPCGACRGPASDAEALQPWLHRPWQLAPWPWWPASASSGAPLQAAWGPGLPCSEQGLQHQQGELPAAVLCPWLHERWRWPAPQVPWRPPRVAGCGGGGAGCLPAQGPQLQLQQEHWWCLQAAATAPYQAAAAPRLQGAAKGVRAAHAVGVQVAVCRLE